MATILAHIKVKPGCEAQFEQISKDLYGASHGSEPGLLRYEYWRGSEPQTYYTLLAFTDFQAFIAHQTSEHHEVASPLLGSVLAGLRLEWVDPIQGGSELPPTENQDLSDSLDELTRSYAKRFAAQVAPWWNEVR
jgi:quinol monooxygenase YgiN